MNADTVPGWYGKLPALGDFASRRLPPDWIAAWDAWLAGGLHRLRAGAPDTWLADYLASPVWRFALLPGALAGSAGDGLRVGVLVPSVDSVGRYFPLVVVSAPLQRPPDGAAVAALWQWAARVEAVAVSALHDDWSAPALDAALADTGQPAWELSGGTLPAHLAAWLGQPAWDALQGCSVWCSGERPPHVAPGLPDHAAFAHLFTAHGSRHAQK